MYIMKTIVNGTIKEVRKIDYVDPVLTLEADKSYYEDRYGDYESLVEERRLNNVWLPQAAAA